jgi:hypothetical protein
LKVSKSGAQRIRRNDPDWRELVTEYDIGGVMMADDGAVERYLARKRERGEAAKQLPPVRRKRGRPPKVRTTTLLSPDRVINNRKAASSAEAEIMAKRQRERDEAEAAKKREEAEAQ